MTLYLISLGLNDEKDISLKGLDAIKKCEEVYLENYTSFLQVSKSKLEKLYNKHILSADRNFVESKFPLKKAKKKNIALLIIGDVFSATTHHVLFQEAKKLKIQVEIIHNASVLTAVGVTGLSLYKFGQTISIPTNYKDTDSPYQNFLINKKNNFHTLFLLDLDLTIQDAINYLFSHGLDKDTQCIACEKLGNKQQKIKTATAKYLLKKSFSQPSCLIIPGKLHFMEEEAIKQWEK